MENLVLPTFRPIATWPTRIAIAVVLCVSVLNAWTHLVHYPNLREIVCIVLGSSAFMVISMGLSWTTAIDIQQKAAITATSLFGRTLWSKKADISAGVWIRARQTSSKLDTITLEIGTAGYQTTLLMTLPDGAGKNIPEAEQWCERIASGLGIQSTGYRRQW